MQQTTETALFVESYPHVIAGQQRTMLSLLARAQDCGMEPILLVPGEGAFVDHVRSTEVDVIVVPYSGTLSRYGGAIYRDGISKRLRTVRDWFSYVLQCRSKLKETKPAAVFCNDMRGLLTVGLAARSLGLPVMIWDKLDKPHGFLDWFQLPLANRNAIISKAVQNKYPRWQIKWYGDRIELIPNGADLERFARGRSIREELGIGNDDVVIAMVGTVTFRKAQDRLLALLPDLETRVPDVKILVVGSWDDCDEDRAYYDSLPNREHPNVTFLGQCDSIEDIMQSIDILAIPSRHEGMGQVTVEAMAAAKPVVGSDVGGIPEVVVDEKTGLIFDGEDSECFLHSLIRLASSPEERVRMGQAGQVRAKQSFSRPDQMMKVCRSLRSLIDR